MKKYIENWRKYLLREEKENYSLYCDLDGVVTDYIEPVLERINNSLKNLSSQSKEIQKLGLKIKQDIGNREIVVNDIKDSGTKSVKTYMFEIIKGDTDFWASLPWENDGKELWQFVKQFNPYILSAPTNTGIEECIKGKKIWIQKNLGVNPNRCFFTSEKYKYASPSSILIDDYLKNTKAWEMHKGIAILHKNAQDTIEKLKKLLPSLP